MEEAWRRGRDSSRQVLANYSNGESYALSCGVATNYPYGQFSLVCLLWPQCGLQNRHQIATKSMSRLGCESSILSQPVLKARRLSDARRQCSNPERRAEFTSFVGPARVPHRWRRPSDTLAWELRRSGRVPGWKEAPSYAKNLRRAFGKATWKRQGLRLAVGSMPNKDGFGKGEMALGPPVAGRTVERRIWHCKSP